MSQPEGDWHQCIAREDALDGPKEVFGTCDPLLPLRAAVQTKQLEDSGLLTGSPSKDGSLG